MEKQKNNGSKIGIFLIIFLLLILVLVGLVRRSNRTSNSRVASAPVQKTLPADKIFSSNQMGYSISYPGDWTYQPGDNEMTWNGPPETDYSDCQVDIQSNLNSPSLNSMISGIKDQYEEQDPQYVDEKDYTFQNGSSPAGKSFEVNYTDGGQEQKDWQVIAGKSGDFFNWSFSAPADEYDVCLPIAKKMLGSWKIF